MTGKLSYCTMCRLCFDNKIFGIFAYFLMRAVIACLVEFGKFVELFMLLLMMK